MSVVRARSAAAALGAALLLAGCGGGPPIHTSRPDARIDRPEPPSGADGEVEVPRIFRGSFKDGVTVRVALHWTPGSVRMLTNNGARVETGDGPPVNLGGGPATLLIRRGDEVGLTGASGRLVASGESLLIRPHRDVDLAVEKRTCRGGLRVSARAGSLFVVNELPLEDYLRGVVPREIGPRPASERAAVAAQAVAARTYAIRKLGQYNGLPFDLYADVQDQVYEGVGGENDVADAAIRDTRGLILAGPRGPIPAYYSSTCGGRRSDIESVWPYRESHESLRGGSDARSGEAWCSMSSHFDWTESWDGRTLSRLFRDQAPALLDLPAGSIRGELTEIRVTERGPSGRAAAIRYATTEGRWTVPGDRNRWIFRRPGGGILRSVFVELDVERSGGRIRRVTARGHGNGHGVGMCQMGAIGRAREGQGFRDILGAYYPGAEVRPIRGGDLPPGRGSAS